MGYGFNRITAKIDAKTSMRGARPSPILVTMVFILLTSVLGQVITGLVFDPISFTMQYLMEGYWLEAIWNMLLHNYSRQLMIYGLLTVTLGVYQLVMGFGYISYTLRLARNEGPSYINLCDGFAKLGRVLWMYFLIGLYTNLWTLAAAAPFVIVELLIYIGDMNIPLFLEVPLMCLPAVTALIVSYRYRMAPYFLLDDPACTGNEAIRQSKWAMDGWKMELFTLDLSFLGWIFLASLTGGILMVWVQPYKGATEANFYDHITSEFQPETAPEPEVNQMDVYGPKY